MGGVGLHEDVLALAVADEVGRGVSDVDEQLIHLWCDRAGREDVVEVVLFEVGDADGTELARPIRVFERTPRLPIAVRVVPAAEIGPGLRAVDQHEVDVVEPHPGEGTVDGGGRIRVVLDLRREFAGYEQLVPPDTTGADPFADASFVPVRLRGVDVAVSDADGIDHRPGGLVVVDEPGAQAQLGRPHPVGQRVRLVQNHRFSIPSPGTDSVAHRSGRRHQDGADRRLGGDYPQQPGYTATEAVVGERMRQHRDGVVAGNGSAIRCNLF